MAQTEELGDEIRMITIRTLPKVNMFRLRKCVGELFHNLSVAIPIIL